MLRSLNWRAISGGGASQFVHSTVSRAVAERVKEPEVYVNYCQGFCWLDNDIAPRG